jgi:hypothetical protein
MTPMLASMAAALVLVLVAAPPLDWLRAQTAAAVATEYGFVPSRLTFQVGVPNRLHLENRGKELHEFTTPALLIASRSSIPGPWTWTGEK